MDVDEDAVDVRCPGAPRRNGTCFPGRLLARVRQSGEQPSYVHPDNHIELYCQDCTLALRKQGRRVKRVLHRYDFLGELMETLIIEEAG